MTKLDSLGAWIIGRWLIIANVGLLLYAGLPWLSPWLSVNGHPLLGALIFALYRPLCHQRPERSFCLCGRQVAFCHRCAAVSAALALGSLGYRAVRSRLAPAPLWAGWLLAAPLLLDAGSHAINDALGLGWRGGGDAPWSVNFLLRMTTGALFALAALVTIYPRLDRATRRCV